MKRRLDAAIVSGLALGGCSDRAIDGGQGESSGAGETTTTTTSGNTASASGAASTTSTVTTDGSEEAEAEVDTGVEPPKFDIGGSRYDFGQRPDVGVLECGDPPELPGGGCGDGELDGHYVAAACDDPGEGVECPPADSEWARELMEQCVCSVLDPICGPVQHELGTCCYWAYDGGGCNPGRPFLVDGTSRVATTVAGPGWVEREASMLVHDDAMLAAAWLHDARTEHAAIASFSRFALQLLAIGAPPRFVAGASQAALDELAHARLCFTLAVRHGGVAHQPGALAIDGALDGSDDLVAIVLATVREGCVAETISALQLAAARDGAEDPWVRARLGEMLEQELAHVELAWSFVAWALARGDARLHAAVRHAFADAPRWIPRGPHVEPAAEAHDRWRRAGRLPQHDRLAIARSTIERIVWPMAETLLARTTTRSADARA